MKLSARRQGDRLMVTAKVKGWARAQIASIELLLGRNGQTPRPTSAPITLRTPIWQQHEISAQPRAKPGSYRVVLRITTYAGTTAEASVVVRR